MVEYWGKLVDAERKPYYYSVGFITIIVVVEYRREQRPRICGRSFCVVFVLSLCPSKLLRSFFLTY